jgi:6-phosphogluconolactonase
MPSIELHPDPETLAGAAAELIAEALRAPGAHAFAATGGSTPGPTYDRLARASVHWSAITVTLTDDRWVSPQSPESNEGLLRRRLFQRRAAEVAFLPLKGDGASPEADAMAAEPALRALLPFAAVLLGMGSDGHIASLFPGAPDLATALDPAGQRLCIGVDQAGLDPRVPRISLTARALLESALIVVLVTGAEKRGVIERVLSDPAASPPVAAVLRQSRTPVRILWAP